MIVFLSFALWMSGDVVTTTFPVMAQGAELPEDLAGQAPVKAETADEIRDGASLAESAAPRAVDFLEPVTFRDSIDDISFTTSRPNPSPPCKFKPKRSNGRAKSRTLLVESKQLEPPPPSFFEELFGLRLPLILKLSPT